MKITEKALRMAERSKNQIGRTFSPEYAQRLLNSKARYIVNENGMTNDNYPISLLDAYYGNADPADSAKCQSEGMTAAEIYDTWDLELSEYTLPYILRRDFIRTGTHGNG